MRRLLRLLPEEYQPASNGGSGGAASAGAGAGEPAGDSLVPDPLATDPLATDPYDDNPHALNPLEHAERDALLRELQRHGWNISTVARELHISRNTLYRKVQRLHIRHPGKAVPC